MGRRFTREEIASIVSEEGKKAVKAAKKAEKKHVPNPKAKNILTDGSQLPSNNPY
jgi:hypothetical protein